MVFIDGRNAVLVRGAAINPAVRCDGCEVRVKSCGAQKLRTESAEHAVVFQDVEDTAHLAEYEHPRSLGFHGFEQFVQDKHLARVVDEVFVRRVRRPGFLPSRLDGVRDKANRDVLTAPSNR